MTKPTNDQRERILRCRKQAQEVERLGLLMEAAQTFLPARLNDGMPRGNNLPYGVDDKLIRAERTRREHQAAVELLEVWRQDARQAIEELNPTQNQRAFLLSYFVDGYSFKEAQISQRVSQRAALYYMTSIKKGVEPWKKSVKN